MSSSTRLQLLTCLIVYVASAHGIRVKFGTRDGPIVPPTPEPELRPSQPFRAPAPVWEQRSNDAPDPNVNWKPPYFKPEPRYTQVLYTKPVTTSSAQQFVNSYIPTRTHGPIQADPITNFYTPAQILGSQSLPGIGLRYFVPVFDFKQKPNQKDDTKLNEIQTNEVDVGNQGGHDAQWTYEKEATRRNLRHTEKPSVPAYLWPVYVAHN